MIHHTIDNHFRLLICQNRLTRRRRRSTIGSILMAVIQEIRAKQMKSGWGGFNGITSIIDLVEFDEVGGNKIEDIGKRRNLGMILQSGKFTPVDLLTKVEDLKIKGVTVSEATAGMLAFATVPAHHLRPAID